MNTTPHERRKKILQLVGLYTVASTVWIFGSDTIVSSIFSESVEQLTEFSILKGMFFVGTTSGLFYLFCRKWQRYLENVETDLRHHAQEVETGRAKHSSIFEVANDALFIIDKNTLRFLEVNDSACTTYGYSNEEFLNSLSALDITVEPEVARTIFASETIRIEYGQHKKSNGQVFPVDITLTYFTLDQRRVIAASVRDMTMHYELVKSLKASEQKFIDAQLMGNVGNWTWDLRTNVVNWSPGLYKISGITPSDLPTIREDFFSLIHPDDRELVAQKLEYLLQNQSPVYWESRFLVDDGPPRYVMNQCLVKADKNGEPIELVGTIADITERKLAEIELLKLNQELEARVVERTQELIEMNRDKDEILSIAAHDLRNPLGGILLQSTLAKMFYEKGQIQQAQERIGDIEKTVQRMNEIITNLLNSHSLDIGKYPFEFEEYECETILTMVIDTFAAQAHHKGIHIHTRYANTSIAYVDKQAFREVIENLLSNAVKYSPHDKNIHVTIETTPAETLQVKVKDEGPGISADDQKRLFGKFVRLSAKPTGSESSSGLGLSIVKKITELMHGTIRCESTIGEGATFIVEFPVHPPVQTNI